MMSLFSPLVFSALNSRGKAAALEKRNERLLATKKKKKEGGQYLSAGRVTDTSGTRGDSLNPIKRRTLRPALKTEIAFALLSDQFDAARTRAPYTCALFSRCQYHPIGCLWTVK